MATVYTMKNHQYSIHHARSFAQSHSDGLQAPAIRQRRVAHFSVRL